MTNQEFIEKWYPDYYRSEDIALASDLFKLMNNEQGDDDDANTLLYTDYAGDAYHPYIKRDFFALQCNIYEEALQNFIKTIGL
jgi:hypothetical protein